MTSRLSSTGSRTKSVYNKNLPRCSLETTCRRFRVTRRSTVSGYDYMLFASNINSKYVKCLSLLTGHTDGYCSVFELVPILPSMGIKTTDSARVVAGYNWQRQREKASSGVTTLSISTPPVISQACSAARCLLTVSRKPSSSRRLWKASSDFHLFVSSLLKHTIQHATNILSY